MSIPLVGLWAVAEATVWPIMPDAVMVPLALRRPASWWRMVVAGVIGTAAGGTVSYALGGRQPDQSSVGGLLLVRPAMVVQTARWLAAEGPRGVWRQPATGVPFKVFARQAGAQHLPLGPFLLWAVAARSLRFTILAGIAALLGRRFPAATGRHFWWLATLWGLAFGLTLWRLVTYWERRGEAPSTIAHAQVVPGR